MSDDARTAGISLEDRVALVTGAGSEHGIGFAAARIMGARGARVAVSSTTERIEARAAELAAAGVEAIGLTADLTDAEEAAALVEAVSKRFGRIDVLVNNAGIAAVGDRIADVPFTELDADDWDRRIAINLKTAFNVTRAVLPGMVARGYGRVVSVSSVSGPVVVYPHAHAYAAAKAGLDGLMRSLAHDYARDGVTCNSVAPGWIATASSTPDEIEAARHTPIGRPGSPEEVGEVIAWLASPGAAYITGQSIVVDGGNTLQEIKGGDAPAAR